MKKIILTHGILGGALISAIMAFSILKYNDVINFNENMIYGFSFMLIAFILPFISIWKFRKVDGT
jgi:high-affinity Fe2+/Pb2+ permease